MQIRKPKYKERLSFRITIISILILLILFCSGCIHIDLGNPFKTTEKKPTEFHIVTMEKFLNHTFDFEADQDLEESETKPFYIKKYTEWVNISIKIELNSYGFLNSSLLNATVLERYVHVTIKGPNGMYFDQEFIESTRMTRSLVPPTPGTWIVGVEARGFGYQGTYDSYEIDVIIYEPI